MSSTGTRLMACGFLIAAAYWAVEMVRSVTFRTP